MPVFHSQLEIYATLRDPRAESRGQEPTSRSRVKLTVRRYIIFRFALEVLLRSSMLPRTMCVPSD